MILNLQIQNADINLLNAIKGVVKLSPNSQMIVKKIEETDKPNRKTIAAFKESEKMLRDKNSKTFSSVDELFEDLDS